MSRFGRDRDEDAKRPDKAREDSTRSSGGTGKPTVPEPTERRSGTTQKPSESRSENDLNRSKSPLADSREKDSNERAQTPERQVYELRNAEYRLNGPQIETLNAVGAFRTIRAEDALAAIYGGDKTLFERDLNQLRRQKLITISKFRAQPGERFIALTPDAKRLIDARLKTNPEQRIYSGMAKVKELNHDGALYKMTAKAIGGLEKDGGKPKRIIIDYELKATLNKELEAAKNLPKDQEIAKLEELARQHDLKVVDGKIPVPDVRVEYETREGDVAHIDLEYVTGNYRASAIAEKARAGFSLYAPSGFQTSSGGSAGRKVLDEYPSLAAEIISL